MLNGRLQQAKALTDRLLCILVALALVFGLEAGPFVRIDRLEVGFLVLAIGDGLWREQRLIEATDWRLRMPTLFLGATDVRRDADRGWFHLMERRRRRIGFMLR